MITSGISGSYRRELVDYIYKIRKKEKGGGRYAAGKIYHTDEQLSGDKNF